MCETQHVNELGRGLELHTVQLQAYGQDFSERSYKSDLPQVYIMTI
jgi:hypothetical protein